MRRLFAVVLFLTVGGSVLGQDYKPLPPVPAPFVEGGKVVLVPRDQLRAGPGIKTARLHPTVRAAANSKAIPVPASWDWTKGGAIKLPILGNDRYGDCYMAAPAHVFQLYGGLHDKPVVWDLNALVRRYLQLSGGDNGLSDSEVFPEVKKGMIGPNGPHKMLDVMIVPSTDKTAMDLTNWAFGPQMFTFTVYGNFMSVKPGTILDGNSGREEGGHAIVISGKTAEGRRLGETWGIQPSIQVTDHWIHGVGPETIACFSLEWFDAKGYAPNGLHYNELAPLWNSMGGTVPAVGPFPPPGNNPPPPPPPVGTSVIVDPVNKTVTVPAGWTVVGGGKPAVGLEAELAAAGVSPKIIDDIVKIVADVKAKAGFRLILEDVNQLIFDLHGLTGYNDRRDPDARFLPYPLAA